MEDKESDIPELPLYHIATLTLVFKVLSVEGVVFEYTDGIRSFETTLRLRQIVAFEHWRGNTACTLGEVIQKVTAGWSAVT